MTDDANKPEFEPLLEPGLYPHTLDEVEKLCVTAFPASAQRQRIMTLFREVVCRLDADGICGDLWVDGSFLTKKAEPDDVDVVMRVDSAFLDACTTVQAETLNWFAGDLYSSHCCHSFLLVQYPKNDPRFWRGEYAYAYWLRQWGFSRKDEMKGVAVVQLPTGTLA